MAKKPEKPTAETITGGTLGRIISGGINKFRGYLIGGTLRDLGDLSFVADDLLERMFMKGMMTRELLEDDPLRELLRRYARDMRTGHTQSLLLEMPTIRHLVSRARKEAEQQEDKRRVAYGKTPYGVYTVTKHHSKRQFLVRKVDIAPENTQPSALPPLEEIDATFEGVEVHRRFSDSVAMHIYRGLLPESNRGRQRFQNAYKDVVDAVLEKEGIRGYKIYYVPLDINPDYTKWEGLSFWEQCLQVDKKIDHDQSTRTSSFGEITIRKHHDRNIPDAPAWFNTEASQQVTALDISDEHLIVLLGLHNALHQHRSLQPYLSCTTTHPTQKDLRKIAKVMGKIGKRYVKNEADFNKEATLTKALHELKQIRDLSWVWQECEYPSINYAEGWKDPNFAEIREFIQTEFVRYVNTKESSAVRDILPKYVAFLRRRAHLSEDVTDYLNRMSLEITLAEKPPLRNISAQYQKGRFDSVLNLVGDCLSLGGSFQNYGLVALLDQTQFVVTVDGHSLFFTVYKQEISEKRYSLNRFGGGNTVTIHTHESYYDTLGKVFVFKDEREDSWYLDGVVGGPLLEMLPADTWAPLLYQEIIGLAHDNGIARLVVNLQHRGKQPSTHKFSQYVFREYCAHYGTEKGFTEDDAVMCTEKEYHRKYKPILEPPRRGGGLDYRIDMFFIKEGAKERYALEIEKQPWDMPPETRQLFPEVNGIFMEGLYEHTYRQRVADVGTQQATREVKQGTFLPQISKDGKGIIYGIEIDVAREYALLQQIPKHPALFSGEAFTD